ncbi:MAG: alpha/beta fold hydrolase [Bacteroidales bacterium]|nr:alpha/beta fold hydrolase [Bacteroidales bacterium]MDP3003708.1 alpha/beta fold hydrolase [Bacteroidales bacterium]
MKSKILKRLLFGLLIIFILSCLLIVTPRIWSAMNPGKPPVGYHFLAPAYLAIGVGLEELINKTPDIPEDIEEIKNIEYKSIDGKSLQLDIYKPKKLDKAAPLLVFIHGGGWSGGQRSDYLFYLVAFAKRGYITATVSYRLLKDGPYPACAEDITDAVSWFYRNGEKYGYDPDRIALIGGSAGAHLALLAAYGWKNPNVTINSTVVSDSGHCIKAVVDLYGPIDLTTEYARNNPTVTSFITRSFAVAPELFREASPIQYLDKNDPPTMILHGTSDEVVPISQSDMLKARLDSLGVPCVYYLLPLWPHTMDIVQRVNDFSQLKMNDFFEKYLK